MRLLAPTNFYMKSYRYALQRTFLQNKNSKENVNLRKIALNLSSKSTLASKTIANKESSTFNSSNLFNDDDTNNSDPDIFSYTQDTFRLNDLLIENNNNNRNYNRDKRNLIGEDFSNDENKPMKSSSSENRNGEVFEPANEMTLKFLLDSLEKLDTAKILSDPTQILELLRVFQTMTAYNDDSSEELFLRLQKLPSFLSFCEKVAEKSFYGQLSPYQLGLLLDYHTHFLILSPDQFTEVLRLVRELDFDEMDSASAVLLFSRIQYCRYSLENHVTELDFLYSRMLGHIPFLEAHELRVMTQGFLLNGRFKPLHMQDKMVLPTFFTDSLQLRFVSCFDESSMNERELILLAIKSLTECGYNAKPVMQKLSARVAQQPIFLYQLTTPLEHYREPYNFFDLNVHQPRFESKNYPLHAQTFQKKIKNYQQFRPDLIAQKNANSPSIQLRGYSYLSMTLLTHLLVNSYCKSYSDLVCMYHILKTFSAHSNMSLRHHQAMVTMLVSYSFTLSKEMNLAKRRPYINVHSVWGKNMFKNDDLILNPSKYRIKFETDKTTWSKENGTLDRYTSPLSSFRYETGIKSPTVFEGMPGFEEKKYSLASAWFLHLRFYAENLASRWHHHEEFNAQAFISTASLLLMHDLFTQQTAESFLFVLATHHTEAIGLNNCRRIYLILITIFKRFPTIDKDPYYELIGFIIHLVSQRSRVLALYPYSPQDRPSYLVNFDTYLRKKKWMKEKEKQERQQQQQQQSSLKSDDHHPLGTASDKDEISERISMDIQNFKFHLYS